MRGGKSSVHIKITVQVLGRRDGGSAVEVRISAPMSGGTQPPLTPASADLTASSDPPSSPMCMKIKSVRFFLKVQTLASHGWCLVAAQEAKTGGRRFQDP